MDPISALNTQYGPRECNPQKDNHWECLEIREKYKESIRKRDAKKDTQKLDAALKLTDPTAFKNPSQRTKEYFFNFARRLNYTTDNWLLLSAAETSLSMFWMSRTRNDSYLERAEFYLRVALANAGKYPWFDNYKSPKEALFTDPIYPTETYFELQLALFQVLTLTRPSEALALGQQLERELKDPRFLKAQGSNPLSAEGYLNRLKILRAITGLHNPDAISPSEALTYVEGAYQWAAQKYQSSPLTLKTQGMNRKDLKHDLLNAKVTKGRLLVKEGKYKEALKIFQEVLEDPISIRKYGGFLDMGKQAFFNILLIALLSSNSLKEAAQKFSDYLDWKKITDDSSFADFRESLGILIRKTKLIDLITTYTRVKASDWREILGNHSLWWGWLPLAPEESASTLSARLETELDTPEERLETIMKLLEYLEIPFDLRLAIKRAYASLGGR